MDKLARLRNVKIWLALGLLALLIPVVFAATVSHQASQMKPGTFGIGNYTFPDSVFVDGKIGIGTTAPSVKLQVSSSANQNVTLISNGNAAFTGNILDLVQVNTGSSAAYNFLRVYDYSNAATRFIIKGNGNVGIGTTVPDAKLTSVNLQSGNVYDSGMINIDPAYSGSAGNFFYSIDSGDLTADKNYYGLYSVARIDGTTAPGSDHAVYAGRFEVSNGYGGG